MNRRGFLKVAGVGGALLLTYPGSGALAATGADQGFSFVQFADTHVGYANPPVNPDASASLQKGVDWVNAMAPQPDFVVFTGDLTHTTDDPVERRRRLTEFKRIAGGLKAKSVYFLPGEHDAALDWGEAYKEILGKTHYMFQHKGVHFLVIDNVSDPGASVGEAQLAWITAELSRIPKADPLVVLTHRPLFDLLPEWDWATKDADKVLALLEPHTNVTVLYGHIHQEHHHQSGHIGQHAGMSTAYLLPAPGSAPKKAPIPWDAAAPYKGMGLRTVRDGVTMSAPSFTEHPLAGM
ncbi:MAG: metallophosphoesterase family protein [Acidobacteriota bacterium]